MKDLTEYLSDLKQGRISRREFIHAATALGVSAGVAYVVASCAPSPSPTAAPSPQATSMAAATQGKGGHITVQFEAGVPKTAAAEKHLPEFTAQTGITVTPVEVTDADMHPKLMTDLQSGSPTTDVGMIFSEGFLPQFAATGLLEPMDGHFTNDQVSDLTDIAKQVSTYNGTLYAWPWYEHTCGLLYYRTDLFKAAGLVDAQGNYILPLTWDEYRDTAVKLTGNGVYGTLVEGKRDQESDRRFIGLIWEAGGDILDEAKTKVLIGDGPAATALQFQLDLLNKYKVSPPGSLDYYVVDNHTLFMQGKLAMTENWPYMFPMANDPTQSQVAGKFWFTPSFGNVKRTWELSQFAWIVPKASKNKDQAFQFLNWLTSRDMLINASLAESVPSDRKSLMNAPEFASHKEFPVVVQAISMARPEPQHPKWPQMRDIIIDEWQFGLLQTKTPQQAMSDCATRLQAIVGS